MFVAYKHVVGVLALVAVAGTTPIAQQLPTTQPKLMTIYREQVKLGHDAAHEANESGWPAAFAQAKSPDYYLAMVSMTGRSEVWYSAPWENYAAWGKAMTRDEANPELTAALTRLSMADAEHLDGMEIIEVVAAPNLSHGTFPDLNKTRFWEVTTMRIRPGHEARFAEAVAVYKTMATRSSPNMNWRTYAVSAGLPGPTFLIYQSVTSFDQFDQVMAAGESLMKGATPAEMATMQKFSTESLISAVSNRFRLSASMSYVSPETRATDPAFWNKK